MNSIAGAYKRKEYIWFGTWIFLVVVGVKLAGIGGAVGAALMMEGLYRTYKNQTYSIGMRALVSFAYIVGGILVGSAIALGLTFALQKFFGFGVPTTEVAKQILNATGTEQVIQQSATTTSQQGSSSVSVPTTTNIISNLAISAYHNSKENFEIQYPKEWTIQEGGTNGTVVQFDDPTPNLLALETVSVDSGLSNYSLQEYAAGGMESFATASGRDQQVKIVSQGPIILNGQSAYRVEFTYLYPLADGQNIPFQAISIFLIRGDRGYNIFATAQVEIWNKYNDVFSESASTFRFLK